MCVCACSFLSAEDADWPTFPDGIDDLILLDDVSSTCQLRDALRWCESVLILHRMWILGMRTGLPGRMVRRTVAKVNDFRWWLRVWESLFFSFFFFGETSTMSDVRVKKKHKVLIVPRRFTDGCPFSSSSLFFFPFDGWFVNFPRERFVCFPINYDDICMLYSRRSWRSICAVSSYLSLNFPSSSCFFSFSFFFLFSFRLCSNSLNLPGCTILA